MRKFLFGAVFAFAALFGSASSADAAFALRYSTDGGASFTTVNNGTNFVSVTVDGLTIQATGIGSTTPALTLMDLGVNGATSGPLDLVVQTSMTGVITTPPPQALGYTFTGSLLPGGSGTITDRAYVSNVNTLFDSSGIVAASDTGALAPGSSGSKIFSATAPYSVTQTSHIHITSTSLASISSDNNIQITAPAPAGLVLALTGLPVFGLGTLVRRVRAKVVA